MKKTLFYAAMTAMAFSTIFIACKKDEEKKEVTGVTFSSTTDSLEVGQTLNLLALLTVSPADADQSVTWTSDPMSVATVFDGVATAVSEGTAIIRATSVVDATKYAEFTLRVKRVPHPVLGNISFLSDTTWTLTLGNETQTWSDAVIVENPDAQYNGGEPNTPGLVSVSRNEGYGDMFSFAAVNEYKTAICPAPWRVPDTNDFRKLDALLGGDGLPTGGVGGSRPVNDELFNKYIEIWNAKFGGLMGNGGEPIELGTVAGYWSSSASDNSNASVLNIIESYQMVMDVVVAPIQDPEQGCGCASIGGSGGFMPLDPNGPVSKEIKDNNAPGTWLCIMSSDMRPDPDQPIRSTNPKGNMGKNAGYQVRCVK